MPSSKKEKKEFEVIEFIDPAKRKEKKPVEVIEFNDLAKRKEKKPVEVIVFNDPARRKDRLLKAKSSVSAPVTLAKDSIVRPVFNQKNAKYDIRKLAIKGMDKSEKEVAIADYLVELGAKKPGQKHVNIKDYMQELKKRKLEGGDDKDDNKPDDDDPVKKPKYKRRRDKDDILGGVDGQIGTYRRGVQFIKGKGGFKNRKR